MSQPPFNYPHFAGQPVGPPPGPYQYAPAPIQPASSFYASPPSATEPSPTTVANNYASINGSFQYNGSSIPGLGISATPTTPYRAETNSRSQPTFVAPSSPAFTAPPTKTQGIVGLQEHIPSYAPDPSINPRQPARSNPRSEEGELSEGEFEDLYEPRGSNDSEGGRKQNSRQMPGTTDDAAGSMGDADGSSIYDTGSNRDEVVINSTSASLPPADDDDDYEPGEYEPEYQPRENSRSYSPHLSPVDTRHDDPAAKRAVTREDQPAPIHQSFPSFAAANPSSMQTQGPSTEIDSSRHVTSAQPDKPSNPAESSFPYKTVSEAKKKAQEAILGLWPLKVRYQNYLDEGLDPQVVKSLFTELGLDVSSLKPAVPLQTPTTSVTTPQVNKAAVQASPKSPAQPQRSSQPPQVSQAPTAPEHGKSEPSKPAADSEPKMAGKKSAQEERKDKIARMLAEKSKKSASQPAAVSTSSTAPAVSAVNVPQPPTEPSEAAKAKLRAENTRKILEKMAALKKQQEKKPESAEQTASTPPTSGSVPQAQVAPFTTATAGTTPQPTTAAPPAPERGSSVAANTPRGPSAAPSPQPNTKSRATKRPVAADFDGYPSSSTILKRTRTQETLIIDVSDDEDVEMDLGSPTDPPTGAAQNNGLTRNNSLASYPPLTNSRSWRGPGSGAGTPGTATPSLRGHKLDFLNQKIEEAKRQIAEAEAKKAAKKTNGTSTPVSQSPVPTPEQMETSRLPKPSEVPRPVGTIERRDRIASYHLPVVEAALREKQDRLQRLQSEAAQLELEVQQALAERQKLTVEMATLEISTESETEKLNGQSEPADSDTTTPQETQPHTVEATPQDSEHDPAENLLSASEQPAVAQEDASASGDDNSVMDIDSDSSSEDHNGGDIITSVAKVATIDGPQKGVTSGPSASQSVIPSGSDEDQGLTSSKNDERSHSTAAPAVIGEEYQLPADADVPMQISDAEDEDDGYEPMPAQISGSDKVQIAEGEDGEVPDEDPYEPGQAQSSITATGAVAEAKTDEVESRSSLSEKDLMSYQSPLRYFHAYRFHPKYLDDVSGGLKSMTYSSRIDVSRPICPFLLGGGQCPNGPSCEFQHFDKMVLSDTAIIADLGSTDMYEGEQKGRFIDGLKRVLQELKANKVKDFDSITKAIVAYRADFLGDKSKVLPLNNVAI